MTAALARSPAGQLPEAVTSFIGRRRELGAIRARMAEGRLVTLVGAPGVGKTRLAVTVARGSARAFPDGVWMADLTSLTDPAELAQTIVAALDVPDQSTRPATDKLVHHLRDRLALVLLDNCEHVLDDAARLTAQLLRTCPRLHLLATSREPLGIEGEHTYTLPPLEQDESVQLLAERARAVRPDFEVTDDNREAVAQLCARLDGLPLAIELAATRLRSLDVPDVVERLDRRFALLVGGHRDRQPRQQTLRGLMDWSFELCGADERRLWGRLSVFAGSFDLGAAEEVCSGDGVPREAVAAIVDGLVAKSLLAVDRDEARGRYRMLVTVRQYGAELLAGSGEEEQLRRRHRAHYLRLARTIATDHGRQVDTLARLRRAHPDLRTALDWSYARPQEARAGAALAAALELHWYAGALLNEGLRRLEQGLRAVPDPTRERAELLWVGGLLALAQGDLARSSRWLAECSRLAETLADPSLAALDAHGTALVRLFDGDAAGSLEPFEAAIARHREAGHVSRELSARFEGIVAFAFAGAFDRARAISRDAVATCERSGDCWARGWVTWATGVLEFRVGALEAARERALEALAAERSLERGLAVAYFVELLSWIVAADGALEHAVRLQGAARAVWRALGSETGHWPQVQAESEAVVRRAERELGPTRCRALLAEHDGIAIPEALAVALAGGAAPAPPADADDDVLSPLTAREREVAALIADGRSNKAIAEALVLSPRTIDGHVERMLAKLGFRSRAQIAAWISERRTGALPEPPAARAGGPMG